MVSETLWVALGNQCDIYLLEETLAEERWEDDPTAENWRRRVLALEKASVWRGVLLKHPIPNYCECETAEEKEQYIAALNSAHAELRAFNFTR